MKHGKTIPWHGPDEDYGPKHHSHSQQRQYGYDHKTPTDVLGPIYRYLDKQVGRPWNDVYSELCANLDKRKLTHAHVFTHIFQKVSLNVVLERDGKYYEVGGYSWSSVDLYVDPRTGILCRQGRSSRKYRPKRDPDPDEIKIDNTRRYQRIEGIWYIIEATPLDPNEVIRTTFPISKIVSWFDRDTGYDAEGRLQRVYVRRRDDKMAMKEVTISKKQCNKKELKAVRALLEKEQR